jgi:hypothetical protein
MAHLTTNSLGCEHKYIALKFLSQPDFKGLRYCLCKHQVEWRRFEDLVRSIVLATDIMDKELKTDRNARWDKAFGSSASSASTIETDRVKARIVLEHMIQASDISHTMQHWHIYIVSSDWSELPVRANIVANIKSRVYIKLTFTIPPEMERALIPRNVQGVC